MTEEDAIKLLNKLEKFMIDTNNSIETLINTTYNLQVDIDKIKKNMLTKKGIIIPH